MSGPARRFLHLDFGSLLRGVGDGTIRAGFTKSQIGLIRTFLHGRLLDRRTFWVARRLVEWFLSRHRFRPGHDILVLNGLPRRLSQARDMAALGIGVRLVVHLACPAHVAWQRNRLARRGLGHEDRSRRSDDTRRVFLRRVRSFARQTLPLMAYYRLQGVPVAHVTVGVRTSPHTMAASLTNALAGLWAGPVRGRYSSGTL